MQANVQQPPHHRDIGLSWLCLWLILVLVTSSQCGDRPLTPPDASQQEQTLYPDQARPETLVTQETSPPDAQAESALQELMLQPEASITPEGDAPPQSEPTQEPISGERQTPDTITTEQTPPPDKRAPGPPNCTPAQAPSGWFAAPTGKPGNDGSFARPWDILTALRQTTKISPGSTLWLRGGTYTLQPKEAFVSKLHGTTNASVTVRSYPGEWAILDGAGSAESTLQVYKGWVVFRDFELTNTKNTRTAASGRPSGTYFEGSHIQLINLFIHDTGNNPAFPGDGLEFYGNIIQNTGNPDAAQGKGHGHGLYAQNKGVATQKIHDNLIFNGFAFGIHAYGENNAKLIDYEIIGNVWWMNGAGSAGDSKLYDNCLIGGSVQADRVVLRSNYSWGPNRGNRNVRLGWSFPQNGSAVVEDNYWVGAMVIAKPWTSLQVKNNTFYSNFEGFDPTKHPQNTYLTQAPAKNQIFVRPNRHNKYRAHIIVYNWEKQASVSYDPKGLVAPGTWIELRSAQNMQAPPAFQGRWSGGPIALPMNIPIAQPIGDAKAIEAAEQTGINFNVFVLQANGPQSCL